MKDYKRLTNGLFPMEIEDEPTDIEVYRRLKELEDKIENGTLVELDESLIGQSIVGIHCFTNGEFELDIDENIIIGFAIDGIVTWNNYHKYNDYFKYGLFFLDTDKGRAEAEQKLRELQNER